MTVDPLTQKGIYLGADGGLMPLMASTRVGRHATVDTYQVPYYTNHDGTQSIDGYRAETNHD